MAFTASNGRTTSSLSEINITPMVDVMLVLLIIFMVTTPIIQSGIEVNLPRTRSVRNFNPRQQCEISIDRQGGLYFMTQPINVNQLGPALMRELKGDRNQPIYLRSNGDVRFAIVVRVMDAIREAGFSNIQIVTRPILEKGKL